MKIIMLKTLPGSVDGIKVAAYESGVEYDLTATDGEHDLAVAFVGAGFATEVGATLAAQIAPIAEFASESDDVAQTPAKPVKAPKQKK